MISIIMPIYNGVEFFEEAYGSVLNQTFEDWELVIAINGHKDSEEDSDVYKFVKEKTKGEPRVTAYDLEIKGYPDTLNFLIQNSKFDYVAVLDVDDKWHPDKLRKQAPHLGEYDIVGTNCQYFGDSTISPRLIMGSIHNSVFWQFNTMIHSSVVVRKELHYYDTSLPGRVDYDMWLRLASQGKKFFNISEILTFHRVYSNSYFNTRGHTKEFKSVEEKLKSKWRNST